MAVKLQYHSEGKALNVGVESSALRNKILNSTSLGLWLYLVS